MSSLFDDLPRELDVHLELGANRTLALTPETLRASGLRPGEPLTIDLHPLSLRLETLTRFSLPQERTLPSAQVDLDGRLSLPIELPFLTGTWVVLQIRHRGLQPELHLVADCS